MGPRRRTACPVSLVNLLHRLLPGVRVDAQDCFNFVCVCYTAHMKLALKITPQRSTQYAQMTTALAAPEFLSSPWKAVVKGLEPVVLAGHEYLLVEVEDGAWQSPLLLDVLGRLGATSEAYEYFERIGEVAGPLLHPIESTARPFVPFAMAEARRYRGKTNETFTRVLLNVALFAGEYSQRLTEALRILDPLSGGGTTLFLALAYGYNAFGIEEDRQDVETTAVFVRQYLGSEHIAFKEVDERGRRAGRRYQFAVGKKGDTRQLVLTNGDTRDAMIHMREVVGGPKMHAVVGDLPYGIQHFAEVEDLLGGALPVWEEMIVPGGTLALAWNATRIERGEMLALCRRYTKLQLLDEAPYNQFAHAVDRVIKRRDILVAVKTIGIERER
jgi:hypothetical protein